MEENWKTDNYAGSTTSQQSTRYATVERKGQYLHMKVREVNHTIQASEQTEEPQMANLGRLFEEWVGAPFIKSDLLREIIENIEEDSTIPSGDIDHMKHR